MKMNKIIQVILINEIRKWTYDWILIKISVLNWKKIYINILTTILSVYKIKKNPNLFGGCDANERKCNKYTELLSIYRSNGSKVHENVPIRVIRKMTIELLCAYSLIIMICILLTLYKHLRITEYNKLLLISSLIQLVYKLMIIDIVILCLHI